jgi:hypothetical protein
MREGVFHGSGFPMRSISPALPSSLICHVPEQNFVRKNHAVEFIYICLVWTPKRDIFGLRTHEVSLQFGHVHIYHNTALYFYTKEPESRGNRYPAAFRGKQTVAPSST